MKFTSSVILMAGMLMPSITIAQNSLEDTWNLLEPAFNYTNKEFQLTYKFSTAINDDTKTKATLYFYKNTDPNGPNNCKSETLDNLYMGGVGSASKGLELLTSTIEDGDSGVFKTGKKETVKVQLNTENIATDTDIFAANVGGDAGVSEVKFCVRFGLCTGECGAAGSYEVNFLESLVKLTVDLRGEFTVTGIDVAPKDKIIRTANQEYGLEAFQCTGKDATGGLKYADGAEPTFNQGDVITVCVQPDATARGDNIYMRQVEKFTYALDGSTTVSQAAIDIEKTPAKGGTASTKGEMFGLTEIDDCRGSVTCVIKTILFATFYTRTGVVTGSGTATMQFGTAAARVRKLRGADERDLQEDDVAGAGEFDVNFQIDSNDSFQAASGASSSMTILALFGSAAAALML